jgi:CPA1 family monovalent cation:H+ antiporter
MRKATTRWVVAGDQQGRPTHLDCRHLDEVRDVIPNTLDGCAECLWEGSRWVHLRECLVCGHVGCCDSSPRQHARAHWRAANHAIVRSFEPGESWAWCYPDELFLLPV